MVEAQAFCEKYTIGRQITLINKARRAITPKFSPKCVPTESRDNKMCRKFYGV